MKGGDTSMIGAAGFGISRWGAAGSRAVTTVKTSRPMRR